MTDIIKSISTLKWDWSEHVARMKDNGEKNTNTLDRRFEKHRRQLDPIGSEQAGVASHEGNLCPLVVKGLDDGNDDVTDNAQRVLGETFAQQQFHCEFKKPCYLDLNNLKIL